MARIRTIKPEFPQSESMGRISRDARLLFIQIWTLCDDEGRTRAASRMLASLLFPYDDDAPKLIDSWLEELEREKCIIRYQFEGQTYLQICNWLNHQKIDKPSRSKIPPFDDNSEGLANPRECSSEDQGSRIKDQGSDILSGQKRSTGYAPEFEEAWAAYPKRPGASKADAFKAWSARIKEGVDPAHLVGGVTRYANYCKTLGTEPNFIKQPATFFGPGRHYESDWSVPMGKAGPARHSAMNAIGVDAETPEGFSDGFH